MNCLNEIVTKKIDTLVEDIYDVLRTGRGEITPDMVEDFGRDLSNIISSRLVERRDSEGTLRMSNIGKPCNRQLWYEVNTPGEKEELEPHVRLKFLFGDILEELLLFLAKAAGHSVEGRQDEQEIEGIKGHRDAIIDGTVVDVKSASTYSFKKFEEGKLSESDPFGYMDQLQSYIHSGQSDEKVSDKDRGAFLVIDKTLGHVCLDIHKKRTDDLLPQIYKYKKEVVGRAEPPARRYEPIPDGKSGNLKLGTECSYCAFKRSCYPELRTFLYSNRPVDLVHVAREPNVPELVT